MDQTAYVSLEREQWKDLNDGDCFSLLPAGELSFRAVVKVNKSPENGTSDAVPAVQVPPPEPQPDPVPVPPSSAARDPQTPPLQEPSTSHADPPTSHGSSPADSVDDLLFGDAPLQPDTEENKTSDASSKLQEDEAASTPEEGSPEDTADRCASSAGGKQSGSDRKEAPANRTAGSTNKPRVLPGWLASIGTSGGGGKGGVGGATKKARAPPSKPAKQKVSRSPEEDPHPRHKPVKVGTGTIRSICATKVGGVYNLARPLKWVGFIILHVHMTRDMAVWCDSLTLVHCSCISSSA